MDVDYHLPDIIVKLVDRLSDNDRERLYFFLGNDIPRRIQDDPSLCSTLKRIESLFNQNQINEEDFTFLISAFDQIQCFDAVKLLREHTKSQAQSNRMYMSLQSIMPSITDRSLENQDDDRIFVTQRLINSQRNGYDKNIEMIGFIPTCEIDDDYSSQLRRKKLSNTLSMRNKYFLLSIFLLLLIIGLVIVTGVFIFRSNQLKKELKLKEKNIFEEQKRQNETIRHLTEELLATLNSLNKSNISVVEIDQINSNQIINFESKLKLNTRWKQDGITIAGGNGQGNQSNQLFIPTSMFVDDDQTLYITDFGNHRIVEWKSNATNGRIVAGRNGPGDQMNQLNIPFDVILNKENNSLIISDAENRRVVQWSRENNTKNGEIIMSDIDCSGLAIDKDGSLYVSDPVKSEVRRWKRGETNGTIVAGGHGEGDQLNQLNIPTYIFVDENYSLFISDMMNKRIMKWLKDANEGIVVAGGNGERTSTTQLSDPRGVTVDQFGQIYVADWDNHRVMRWRSGVKEGTIIVGGNGKGNKSNQINHPAGLSFDREGNLYVLDCANERIQKFEIDFD